jgi:alcohol dehydrogenase class IV
LTVFGEGAIGQMGALLKRMNIGSLFLVTGTDSFERSGASKALRDALGRLSVVRFDGVRPNPTIEQVGEAVEALRAQPCDGVLGVGGGSTLDVAKTAAALAAQPGDLVDYVARGRAPVVARTHRLVLVPTTAGSGSEATRFAAVYVDGRKRSIDHPSLRCDAALVDPVLTWTQPPRVAASSGLDAFSQAVESSWSVRSTARSRTHARRALRLLTGRLPAACREGSPAARRSVALAAHLSGRAIDVSRTTAAHALAYPLTAHHGIDHGHACALNLSWLLEHNSAVTPDDVVDPRGQAFVRARVREVLDVLGVADGRGGRAHVLGLVGQLGLSRRLDTFGIGETDLPRIVAEGLGSERAANNPRRIGAEAAGRGLRSLLGNWRE